MRSEDLEQFAEAMNGLAMIKTGAKLSKEALRVWWNAFQSWSIEDFRAAASHFVTAVQWMPNPYHFAQLQRAGELKGPEAWSLVLNGAELDPNSRMYRAAQCVGGQYYIRHANLERDVPHIERRFLEAYEQLSEVEPIREALPQIAKPTHVALRGPAPLAKCLPRELQRAEPAAAVELPAPPAAPKVVIADSVRVERLARAMPTATDDELAKVARVDAAIVRQVRAALESAA